MNEQKRENGRKRPNDPKLSDGGAWRGSCEGGAQKEAADVGQRWLGGKTPKPESAATVTRGAVRCSAWLGVAFIGAKRSTAQPESRADYEENDRGRLGNNGAVDGVTVENSCGCCGWRSVCIEERTEMGGDSCGSGRRVARLPLEADAVGT